MKEQKGITLIALIITIIVMLILAGVSISLTVGEDGVINKANQAVERTTMAQIRERADLVKAAMALDVKMEDADNIIVTKEFKERLAKELDGRIEGNKVIVKGDEYAVTLRGADLEIDISEYNGSVDESSILSQTCEITDDNKVNINISIANSKEFQAKITDYSEKIAQNASLTEKEKGIAEYFALQNDVFKGATTIDGAVMQALEAMIPGTSYSTLNGWLTNDEVKGMAASMGITDLKVEHLYSYVLFGDLGEDNKGITKETIISYYPLMLYTKYESLIDLNIRAHQKLAIYVKKEGQATTYKTIECYGRDEFTESFELDGPGIYEISIGTYETVGKPRYEYVTEKIIVNKLK